MRTLITGFIFALLIVQQHAEPLCTATNIFQGKWNLVQDSFRRRHFCHTATNDMIALRQDRYLCDEYRPAVFKPSACRIHSISDAMRVIKKYITPAITYVGDSLAGQQFIAASCLAQDKHFRNVNFQHTSDFFLDHVTRCNAQCIDNATYRSQFSGEYFNPCYSCPDGTITSLIRELPTWVAALPPTNVLVLNSGAWYNAEQGLEHSNTAYHRMLQRIVPILDSYIASGVLVMWVTLPPAYISNITRESYHWHYFARKNELAKEVFRDTRVIVIDPTPATIVRKVADYHVSHDAVHWCLSGRTSIPAFINKVILHIIATQLELRQ